MIKKKSYDAFVIDGYLPDGDGLELIQHLRKEKYEGMIAFVSIGYRDSKQFQMLKEEYAIDYVLIKPLLEEDLKTLFSLLLGKQKEGEKLSFSPLLEDLRKEYERTIFEKVSLIEQLD